MLYDNFGVYVGTIRMEPLACSSSANPRAQQVKERHEAMQVYPKAPRT